MIPRPATVQVASSGAMQLTGQYAEAQKPQRGEAATEAERDRSPVAAAPHEAG